MDFNSWLNLRSYLRMQIAYVFNHAFLIPGVIAITLCVILGFIFGGIML
ncbi:hypothetical protein, partial [Klebsiella pneumoniae]